MSQARGARERFPSALPRPVHGFSTAIAALALWCAMAQGVRADERPEVGHGASALPAVDTVGVLSAMRAPVAATAQLGYGLTESVIGSDDAHHRAGAQVAASFALRPWIAVAGRFDGRLDTHDGDPDDDGAGFVAQSQLRVRSSLPLALGHGLRLGAEAGLRFPGASDIERGLSSTSAELQALCTFAPQGADLWLAGLLGFRLDRARHGVEDPSRLGLSDRVALGASDSNALLFGVALSRRLGTFDLLGEWSWDVQVGDMAPAPLQSPMRVTAGARYFPTRALHVQLLAGVSPSARPDVSATGPLYLIEPRVWVGAGIGLYFSGAPSAPRPQPAPAPGQPPPVGAVHGRVIDSAGGAPLARVAIEVAGRTPLATDARGGFMIDGLAPGEVELRASAPGFREARARVNVTAGRAAQVDIALERELPDGQIRGSVRGFDGKPLPARIRVEPLGAQLQLDAEGNFELDVAPGEYRIVISAPGYQTQERPALVEHNGVTVILVELSRER
jgi:hypothetical protein